MRDLKIERGFYHAGLPVRRGRHAVGMELDNLKGSASMSAQWAHTAIVSPGLWLFLITLKEKIMRNLSMLVFILTSFAASLAAAAEAKVDITSPADGSKLNAKAQSKLAYEVTLGG